MPPLNLYARVRFFAQFCTRDRGCSVHPAFPAPSDVEGASMHNPGASRRGIVKSYLEHRHCEEHLRRSEARLPPNSSRVRVRSGTHNSTTRMKGFIGTHLTASPTTSIGDFAVACAIKLKAACAQRLGQLLPRPACGERVGVRGILLEFSARRVPLTRSLRLRPLPASGAR
jgi:hypothetical protein